MLEKYISEFFKGKQWSKIYDFPSDPINKFSITLLTQILNQWTVAKISIFKGLLPFREKASKMPVTKKVLYNFYRELKRRRHGDQLGGHGDGWIVGSLLEDYALAFINHCIGFLFWLPRVFIWSLLLNAYDPNFFTQWLNMEFEKVVKKYAVYEPWLSMKR